MEKSALQNMKCLLNRNEVQPRAFLKETVLFYCLCSQQCEYRHRHLKDFTAVRRGLNFDPTKWNLGYFCAGMNNFDGY